MTDADLFSRFEDGKADDALRTIGEVSAAFGIKQHILRYWEQQFPMLRPLKRSGNRRYYRSNDIALVEQIDQLINKDGYTLKGALQVILSGGAADKMEMPATEPSAAGRAAAVGATADILSQLRAIRSRLAQALAS